MFCGMPGYKPVFTEKNCKQLEDQSGKTVLAFFVCYSCVVTMQFLVGNQFTQVYFVV